MAKLEIDDLYDTGDQYCLHFIDKGGKSREIPVRHDLQLLLFEYRNGTGVSESFCQNENHEQICDETEIDIYHTIQTCGVDRNRFRSRSQTAAPPGHH